MDFYENYRFGGRFFLSPEFCFRLISQTFRLEIGQREGLLRRIIVFLANLRRFGLRHGIF